MDLAFWRDVSIVFLAIQTFILLIIPLAIFYFMVRGLNFLHVRLPRVLFRAQDISKEVRTRTEAVSERIADPLIKADREGTRAKATATALFPSGDRSSSRKADSNSES